MSRYRSIVLLWGLGLGTVSGLVLGFFLRIVQQQTGSKVYTLLLNVDFLPLASWFGGGGLPEWFEFLLHLLVSLVIGIVYAALLRTGRSPWRWGLLLGLLPSLLYLPLTQLSDRVPSLYDVEAIAWWLAGHVLYSLVLVLGGSWLTQRN